MFAVFAVMFTIQPRETKTEVSLREQLLKIYRMTGHVRFAGRRRVNFLQNDGSNFKSKRYLCWLRRWLPQRISYTPAEPPPCRLDIIFDLKPEKYDVVKKVDEIDRKPEKFY
jgi:hypothetical protein